jgi:hypothetical protein
VRAWANCLCARRAHKAARDYLRYERGVTEAPGLNFVGLHWQHMTGSGPFYQVGRDAESVVDHFCHAHDDR